METSGMRRLEAILFPLVGALFVVCLHQVFVVVPSEVTMGVVQRIFYFHVPSAWVSFLGFLIVFVASILYLVTGRLGWDTLAHAAAELGVLFCTIVLVTGPIWARPIWGTWWTWEARLTTTLVLWLLYASYLLVRRYTDDPDQQARFAAVVGILGFLDVPVVYWSIKFWRGHHPLVLKASGGGGLEPTMQRVFLSGIATYIALYLCLLALRIPMGRAEEELRWLTGLVASRRKGD